MTHPYTTDTERQLRARMASLRRLMHRAAPAYREGLRERLDAARADLAAWRASVAEAT